VSILIPQGLLLMDIAPSLRNMISTTDTHKEIIITKASGQQVPFSPDKLMHSLQRAGADLELNEMILKEIRKRLYKGISTQQIYQMAFAMLEQNSRSLAAKYKLKQAIMELGPSGFPFEKYVAALLSHQGFKVAVGKIVQGKCVSHEVDIIAEKTDEHFMIECKYHNLSGAVCDVKVPLYIQARFKDVEASWLKLHDHGSKFHQGWVVTNTRFTDDAIQYGTCAGLKLIGWNYPYGESLKEQVDSMSLYPVTCLTTLSKGEKQRLLEQKIVLCKELFDDEKALLRAGIKRSKINAVLEEAIQLCQHLSKEK
jgi:hypothetical protein